MPTTEVCDDDKDIMGKNFDCVTFIIITQSYVKVWFSLWAWCTTSNNVVVTCYVLAKKWLDIVWSNGGYNGYNCVWYLAYIYMYTL